MKQKALPVRHSVATTVATTPQASEVESTGELHPHGILTELVRDHASGDLGLIKITAQGTTVGKQITHDGVVYVAPRSPARIVRGIVLPAGVGMEPVSIQQICAELLGVYGNLLDETAAWMLNVIILATWAVDWLSARQHLR